MNMIETKVSLIDEAKALAKEHENFYETHVVGGRRALYELLGKIMKLTEEFDKSTNSENLYKLIRNELRQKYQIKIQDNTSNVNALVRYITRSDRKAAHIYTRVIEVAKSKKVPATSLPAYIKAKGGVEKIRAMYVSEDQQQANNIKHEMYNLAFKNWFHRIDMPFTELEYEPSITKNSEACDFEFYVSKKKDGQKLIVGQVPANMAFQNHALKLFADYLEKDAGKAREGTDKLMKVILEKKMKLALEAQVLEAEIEANI